MTMVVGFIWVFVVLLNSVRETPRAEDVAAVAASFLYHIFDITPSGT
jgi:hypothetical protein